MVIIPIIGDTADSNSALSNQMIIYAKFHWTYNDPASFLEITPLNLSHNLPKCQIPPDL